MTFLDKLVFAPDVAVETSTDTISISGRSGGLLINHPGVEAITLLERLSGSPLNEDRLVDGLDIFRAHYLLARLDRCRLLSRMVEGEGWHVRLDPASPRFIFQPGIPKGAVRLSRFAWLRRCDGHLILESPLGHGRLVLEGTTAAILAGALIEPHTTETLAAAAGVSPDEAGAVLELAINVAAVGACDSAGRLFEDQDPALRQWEFHDLLFHTRSRLGRRDGNAGGTFPFLGQFEPRPVLKPALPVERIALVVGNLPAEPIQAVMERRRSRRTRGPAPMTVETLGLFLQHSARPLQMLQGDTYMASLRPAPSAGATHSLELYLTVTRVAGLDSGFYHYEPGIHALERLGELNAASESLVETAAVCADLKEMPDVVITLASRFARVSWKYEAIAYAVILKDAGALIHQMYLVATALGLSPSATGVGDSDAFAEASGMPYYEEGAVADFILSSV